MKNQFRIECDSPTRGRIWLNGVQLKEVVAFKVEARTDKVNLVTIELYAASVNFDGKAIDVTTLQSDSRQFIKT